MPASTTPDTKVLTDLGVRLALARRRHGLTLANVAERGGVSPAHVSQIESGTANPTLRTLLQVAAAVGADAAELFGHAEPAAPAPGPEPAFTAEHARAAITGTADGTDAGVVAVWDRTADGACLLSARVLHGTVGDHAMLTSHAGEEFVVVVRGSCRLQVGALTWELSTGDSCHFDAGQPHLLAAPSPDLLLSVVLSGHR